MDGTEPKIKPDYHPLLIRYIPFFHGFSEGKRHPSGVKSMPGRLDQDSLLKIYLIENIYMSNRKFR